MIRTAVPARTRLKGHIDGCGQFFGTLPFELSLLMDRKLGELRLSCKKDFDADRPVLSEKWKNPAKIRPGRAEDYLELVLALRSRRRSRLSVSKLDSWLVMAASSDSRQISA